MSKDLKTKIKESIQNLTTLEIITAVGQVKHKSKGDTEENQNSLPDLDYEHEPKIILTKIDLLQGDIKTVYNEEFVTGNYQNLRDFHAEREKQGYEIIQKNINALERLLNLVNAHSEA
ncbi:hypothetical protein QUF70_06010 [Desulfobacterales bacterium HSG17]|nr:hypothetical protein [Desulfobacterales bacterium HSG17]